MKPNLSHLFLSLFCLYTLWSCSPPAKEVELALSGEPTEERWPNSSSYTQRHCFTYSNSSPTLFSFLQDLPFIKAQDSIIIMGLLGSPCLEDSFRLHLFYMMPGADGQSKVGSFVLSNKAQEPDLGLEAILSDTLMLPGWVYGQQVPEILQNASGELDTFFFTLWAEIHALPKGTNGMKKGDPWYARSFKDDILRDSTYREYLPKQPNYRLSGKIQEFSNLPWHLQFDFPHQEQKYKTKLTYDSVFIWHYPSDSLRYPRASLLRWDRKETFPNQTYQRLHNFIWSHPPCIGRFQYFSITEMGVPPPSVFAFAKAGKQLRLSYRGEPDNPESAGFYAWYNRLAKAFGICRFEDW